MQFDIGQSEKSYLDSSGLFFNCGSDCIDDVQCLVPLSYLDLLCDISFTPTTFSEIWLLFLRAALKG